MHYVSIFILLYRITIRLITSLFHFGYSNFILKFYFDRPKFRYKFEIV